MRSACMKNKRNFLRREIPIFTMAFWSRSRPRFLIFISLAFQNFQNVECKNDSMIDKIPVENTYEAHKCFCCPWHLLEQTDCKSDNETSFHPLDIVLRYYRGNATVISRYESLTNKSLTMLGIGPGLAATFGHCIEGEEREAHWSGWTLNHRTLPDVRQNPVTWERFYRSIPF